jgi:hypothetical protein
MKRLLICVAVLMLCTAACRFFSLPTADNGTSPSRTDAAKPDTSGYFLPVPGIGLDGLESYQQELSIAFFGTEEGKSFEYSDQYIKEVSRTTDTQFLQASIQNGENGPESFLNGNAGEAHYNRKDKEDCQVFWGETAEGSKPLSPELLLPALASAVEGTQKEVNGVMAKGYSLDAESLGFPGEIQVEGEAWTAVDGGYVVMYVLSIQAREEYFGEGREGKQEISYELSEVNSLNEVELPEGCLPVLIDFPATPDVQDLSRLPGLLTYISTKGVDEVQAFYEDELTSTGWELLSAHPLQEGGVTLVFRQFAEKQIAYIALQSATSGTWVTVEVQAEETPMPSFMP